MRGYEGGGGGQSRGVTPSLAVTSSLTDADSPEPREVGDFRADSHCSPFSQAGRTF